MEKWIKANMLKLAPSTIETSLALSSLLKALKLTSS